LLGFCHPAYLLLLSLSYITSLRNPWVEKSQVLHEGTSKEFGENTIKLGREPL